MTLCLLCDRELYGDQAGHYLCGGCTRATGERLDRMPRLYIALAAFLQPAQRRPELGNAARAEAPLPVSEPVLNLRGPGGIVGVLEDWRSALHADLGWTRPVPSGSVEDRVKTAANGLGVNVLYIASSWSQAGTFAEEIRDLERDAVSIVDPPERTIRLGECPTVMDDGEACRAVLRVPPGTTGVRCRWCGTEWPPETWLSLAARQVA